MGPIGLGTLESRLSQSLTKQLHTPRYWFVLVLPLLFRLQNRASQQNNEVKTSYNSKSNGSPPKGLDSSNAWTLA